MKIWIYNAEDQVNEAGAAIISGLVLMNPRAVLGLATGGTPVGIYKRLAADYKRGMFSLREVTTFNLDEYVGLPSGHPQSYRTYMQEHLFQYVDLPADQAHLPDGQAADAAEECRRYDALIARSGAGRLDLQLLGLGHNGHIGFNEPGSALTANTHVVTLAEETRQANARFFDSPDEVPKQAITMGVGTILNAKTVLLVVKGADKADVVRQALQGPVTTDCPASLLQTHPNLIVLLDAAAAGKLA